MYVKRVIRNGNRIITYLIKKPKETDRSWRILTSPASVSTLKYFALPSAIVLFGVYAWYKQNQKVQERQPNTIQQKLEVNEQNKSSTTTKFNKRKSHFESYASFVLEDGQFLMTPRDFIDSIIYRSPRCNINSKVLSDTECAQMNQKVLKFKKSTTESENERPKNPNPQLFRNLNDSGLISYMEYIFLMSLLTKPKSGYRIAFDLIDISDQGTIIQEEFSTFCQIGRRKFDTLDNEKITTTEEKIPNTFLTQYFFGPKGDQPLTFEEFSKFVHEFQREMLLIEFFEYSRGHNVISFSEFMEILLKYTVMIPKEKQKLMSKLRHHEFQKYYIPFNHFEAFSQVINNIDDFKVITQMFSSSSGRSLSQSEFKRAIQICSNTSINHIPEYITDILYKIFTNEEDHRFAIEDFLEIMKNRQNRKLRKSWHQKTQMSQFKHCVKNILRENSHHHGILG